MAPFLPIGTAPTIVDVREQLDSESISTAIAALRTQILAGLSKAPHNRSLPTLLLYDERGLRLYDDLTSNAFEYYLFGAEEQILTDHAPDIVKAMGVERSHDAVVVELGAGSLRKTSHILLALAQASAPKARDRPPVTYYALDLERKELLRTLDVVSGTIGQQLRGKVDTKGMWGTYDGGLAFIRNGGLVVANDDDAAFTDQGELDGKATPLASAHATFQLPPSLVPEPESVRPPPIVHRASSPAPSDTDSSSVLDTSTIPSTRTPPTSHRPEGEVKSIGARSRSPSPHREEDQPAQHPPLHFMFLGSSLGNFPRPDAVEFLKSLPLRPGSVDTLLLGLDHRNDGAVVKLAYNDPRGWTTRFQLNGLRVAERVLQGRGDEVDKDYGEIFKKDGWVYQNEWNDVEGRHEGFYRSTKNQSVVIPPDIDRPQDPEREVVFEKDELINFEYSYKYSTAEALALFSLSNLRIINRWIDASQRYSVWLLERPAYSFPLVRTPSAKPIAPSMPVSSALTSFPAVPTLAEWSSLWCLWDTITLGMIPEGMLHTKPIDLRHKCLFYLGHIPAFLDIHLTRILRKVGKRKELEGHTEPERFKDIFERGIDPHVDDPSVIHPHSEVPEKDDDWPALHEILAFRDRVRSRVIRVYEEHGVEVPGSSDPTVRDFPRELGRVLWMTWEHEAFHAETLLYMLIQKTGEEGGTIPPPGFAPPQWDVLKANPSWSSDLPTSIVTIGGAGIRVSLGHDDIEADDPATLSSVAHSFGWDNESPKRLSELSGPLRVETRPVLNGEYYDFWLKEGRNGPFPALWARDAGGNVQVKTIYGPVPLSTVARNWPFIGSYDELNAFAAWKGGRLPTEPELRLYVDLYEEGAEENNIGLRNWHPIPPKIPQEATSIKGHNGGVWEWTSTKFAEYDGFEKSTLYPGYSSDFFDDKHHVVLGGSYATVPRLAQRRSLRNWYQHNYPYAWIGGRVVYDA